MRIDPKALSRIQRLRALAERGVGGEKETAERSLRSMLAQYGYTIFTFNQDYGEEVKEEYVLKFADRHGKALYQQIISRLRESSKWTYWTHKGRTLSMTVELTRKEYVEVRYLYKIYRRAWETAIEDMQTAFFWKHGLLAPLDENAGGGEEVTEEMQKRAVNIAALMDGLETVSTRKALKPGAK